MKAGGWDDPATARAYRAFEQRHSRYRRANEALARQAALKPGLGVLDLAAGTGGTTAALLPALGPEGRVEAVERAAAMAAAGRERLGPDPRVRWHRSLAAMDRALGRPGPVRFDRIVCGAAIWQWLGLPALLRRLAQRLAPGGALVFTIPAAYLGEPDGPGGGSDPYLTALLATATARHAAARRPAAAAPPLSAANLEAALRAAGLVPRRWQHRQRLSQAAWRDWWCLPVLTAAMWPGVGADERARRIRAAACEVDMRAWRPERWTGWTAWKPAFATRALPDATALLRDVPALRSQARRDGVLLLRGALAVRELAALRRQVQAAAQAVGLLDRRGRWIGGTAAAPHEIPRWILLQQRMGLLPAFQALITSPRLIELVGHIVGEPVQGGRGSVCRIAPPEHQVPATAPHRDAEYLRESRGVWSAWIPLQACAVDEGVLAVAPGTHRGAKTRWAASAMAPGDVLLLSAHTLHRACPNLRLREPRLSIDLRFGPAR